MAKGTKTTYVTIETAPGVVERVPTPSKPPRVVIPGTEGPAAPTTEETD